MDNGARGIGKGARARIGANRGTVSAAYDKGIEQIEYFLYQSTQGIHFMFQSADIARVMKYPTDEEKFFTADNMQKVQELLSGWLDRPTLSEKRSFLDSVPEPEFELLIRAYFHLVENTILAHSDLRH